MTNNDDLWWTTGEYSWFNDDLMMTNDDELWFMMIIDGQW